MLWRADGTSFPAEYWSYPVRREEEVVGAVVTFVDITERKRSEEALRRSEERLRLALDAGRMGTWDWDIRTNEVVWSDNLEAILGLPPAASTAHSRGFGGSSIPPTGSSWTGRSPVRSRNGRTTRSSSAWPGRTARSAGCRARDGSSPTATGDRRG